jgi:hypothetical protein
MVEAAAFRNSPLFTQARKAHDTAAALLSRIAGLSADDRMRLEAKVVELRSRLDQVLTCGNLRSFPASVAS